jgi:hypothetical protein
LPVTTADESRSMDLTDPQQFWETPTHPVSQRCMVHPLLFVDVLRRCDDVWNCDLVREGEDAQQAISDRLSSTHVSYATVPPLCLI